MRARGRDSSAKRAAAEPRPKSSSQSGETATPKVKDGNQPSSINGSSEARTPAESLVTPADFSSALQKSIDELQTRLSSLTNPITNFAVKEFRIEAPVVLSVSPLGTLLYRFLDATENVEPSAITRMSLTLVPIEKKSSAGSLPPSLFEPDARIDDLPGIDSATIEALRRNKVYTVGEFWQIGSRASARVELEGLLKIDRARLTSLLSEAELLLVRGIGKTEAQALFEMGVTSLADLAKLQPQALAEKFNQATGKKDSPLDPGIAETWIKAARSYAGLTTNVTSESSSSSSVRKQ